MTDFSSLLAPDDGGPAQVLHLVDTSTFPNWLTGIEPRARACVSAAKFTGKEKSVVVLPGGSEEDWSAAIGVSSAKQLGPWCLAAAASKLPAARYRLQGGSAGGASLGWLLAQYNFDRYKSEASTEGARVLLLEDAGDAVAIAEAIGLVRDLVNTPAQDLGPAELADIVAAQGGMFGASIEHVSGERLLAEFPMIHAVGRAADSRRGPRLVDLRWGNPDHPKLALIGKGVCFDTGGLDIKPASAMLLMKKDMGGAAHALALARLVMQAELPVCLRLLIPAVENSVSGNAFRPGDVLVSRSGISVEIDNTDAEGRLVLADALTAASAEAPDLVVDFATLTGAARVALGPELPALFTRDEELAGELLECSNTEADPLWRLPLWDPYMDMLKSDIADTANSSSSGFAGAITAALFLQKFVPETVRYAHFDVYAWNASARPGRPKGGEALAMRATWRMLQRRYGDPNN